MIDIGYMGLSVMDSDMAASVAYEMEEAVAKVLKRRLKDKENEYNTDGIINVAMIFDEIIIPNKLWGNTESLVAVAKECQKMLLHKIKEDKGGYWDSRKNRQYHLRKYQRLAGRLDEFIQNHDW